METSARTACEPQLLSPLQLHTVCCLGPRATTVPRWFARKIQKCHPAASCAGALGIATGVCVRAGLQQGLPKLRVRALQPHSCKSKGHWFVLQSRSCCSSGEAPTRPSAVLVKMTQCNKLLFLFPVTPGWFLSHTVGCTVRVSSVPGRDPVSCCLQRDRPTF